MPSLKIAKTEYSLEITDASLEDITHLLIIAGNFLTSHSLEITSSRPEKKDPIFPLKEMFTPEELAETVVTPPENLNNLAASVFQQNANTAVSFDLLDSKGTTWNANIHARTQSKNKDGTWKIKRGSGMEPTAPNFPINNIPAPPALASPLILPQTPSLHPTSIPMPPPIISTNSFPHLMNKITSAMANKKITHEQLLAVINNFGILSLPEVKERPESISQIIAALDEVTSR